ncbi:DNA end-binding protein Ku [Pseudonocardia eucalypti]|nr:DNA end-binding protein Ku [Pseudonocardia eucalypti]
MTIPVGLYSATDDHAIHFHQLERGTGDRIRNRRVNERTQREVDYADIVKGRDLGDGEYVVVEPEELDAIAPGRSRSLDIDGFVDLDEIDPVYFQRTYWLAPGGEASRKPYQLLVAALEKLNRVGIATFIMRGREHLAAIRADRGHLALDTLHFADEIRQPPGESGERAGTRGKELDMALSLIESMSGPWRPGDHHDTYRERVERLIEDKRAGREVVAEAEPAEATPMSDLLDALERSVSARRGTPDLDSASKAQLTDMARELGVKGRSKMTRIELRRAVEQATEGQGRKAS